MTAVHQVLAGAAPRDAITNHALEAQRVITGLGLQSEIFAEGQHIDPSLRSRIHGHDEWPRWASDGDTLIVHYSIDSPAFHELLVRAGTVGLQYHNITPPELLWRYSPSLARQCAEGRRRLAELVAHIDVAAADSVFNAAELQDLGFEDPHVIGILRDQERTIVSGEPVDDRIRMLFVGRGVANKAQDDLVLTLASLKQAGIAATLRLAGGWGPGTAFEARCRWLARRLDVEQDVAFLGSVSDHQLAQEYAVATVFTCASRHEGYFVPGIEAMEATLPIVAAAAGAVPETIGGAGLVIENASPSALAEAVLECAKPDARHRFSGARRRQLEHHSHRATSERLVTFVEALL